MSAAIITSVVTGGTSSHATVSEEANAYATDFVGQGIVGALGNTSGTAPSTGGFAVNQDASPDLGVTVSSGVAYVTCTPASQDSQTLRARMSSNYASYTINANSSGSTAYDWIYLQANATNAGNPDTAADNVINLYTSRSTSNASDNGSPPTYGTPLAVVTVVNGATTITAANITDKRTQSTLSTGIVNASTTGWNTLGFALTYASNNGNKEFTVTSPNNLTTVLSPGMKIQVARSITPSSQCMAFVAANSQYATVASPTGITFTGTFSTEAWIYLNSYATGSNVSTVISRDSGSTSGWSFDITSSGQLSFFWRNSSGASSFNSYQSIPLKTWTHIAAVATSVTSPAASMYVNGSSVAVLTNSTSATSVVQGTQDLRIGARPTPSGTYLDGYLSEIRLWSVAIAQSTVQGNMGLSNSSLLPNANVAAAFAGEGNFTDGTGNGNNLTANGGAIATQAANPFNALEYGLVSAVSYSNPTSTVTIYTGTGNMIPNQTLNTPLYSNVDNPFGWPGVRWRWYVAICSNFTSGTTSDTAIPGLTMTATMPIGRRLNIRAYSVGVTSSGIPSVSIFDTSTSGARLQAANGPGTGSLGGFLNVWAADVPNPTATPRTFIASVASSSGNPTVAASAVSPGFLLVEVTT